MSKRPNVPLLLTGSKGSGILLETFSCFLLASWRNNIPLCKVSPKKRRRRGNSTKHNEQVQIILVYGATALLLLTLVVYLFTRDGALINSAFTSPFLIIIAYYFGSKKK